MRTTRLLLDCGAAIDASDEQRRTALHQALISYQLIPGQTTPFMLISFLKSIFEDMDRSFTFTNNLLIKKLFS